MAEKLFKTVLFLLWLIVIASFCQAKHITCDPQNGNVVTKYEVLLNNNVLPAGAEKLPNNKVRLNYNIDYLQDGIHVIKARALDNDGNKSDWSQALTFSIGELPTPEGLSISQAPTKLPRNNWSIYHVSSENIVFNEVASNTIDGDLETFWHSQWSSDPVPKHPHEIQINMGKPYTISGFCYLPRQDEFWNGGIKKYMIYVSADAITWSKVAAGEFPKDKAEQKISFPSCQAKYISLVAVSEVNGNDWTSVAEIDVVGY